MKIFYRTKPNANAYRLANNEVAVCIDWEEKKITCGKITVNGYECTQVNVPESEFTTDNLIEKFVREKYSQSEEFSLINAYNASISGIEKNEEKESEYQSFLTWRAAMKEQVKTLYAATKDIIIGVEETQTDNKETEE